MNNPPDTDSLPDLSADGSATLKPPAKPAVRQIGPYKVLQKIAEGGMGIVYMAEQKQPIRRRVALKVIKTSQESDQVIARFEAERQALAMMEHPNIAKILDAGTTETGSPYFVMELVKGIPFTEYCDNNCLAIRDRLELFVQACRAVQHAHLKGIIHRDLKPSNILVALHDGVPIPKVIDFGLAKATNHQTRLTDKTVFTEFGQIVGTLQYMSPEQAELNQLDVDTRTDVYSLGVMLYELLTGSTPLEQETLRENALLKVLDLIRDHEPPRPSLRLSASGEARAGISKQRKIAPEHLQQMLAGDLDWVVMKALEKERSRRYETATALADDILRHLQDETVTARPPTTIYRLRKFTQKNRLLVAAVATVATLLVIGILATTWQAIRATQAESEAVYQQRIATRKAKEAEERRSEANVARELESAAREAAQAAEDQAKGILRFVTDSFSAADPTRGAKKDMRARDVLLHAMSSVDEEVDDLSSQAEVYATLAKSFHGLGDEATAIKSALKAKALFTQLRQPEQAIANNNLIGEALLSRGDAYRAWEVYSDSVANLMQRQRQNRIADHKRSGRLGADPLIVDALIGVARSAVSPSAEMSLFAAEAAARNAVAAAESCYGPMHAKTVQARTTLAGVWNLDQQTDKAIALYEDTLQELESESDAHSPQFVDVTLSLARLLADIGQLERAIVLCKKAVAVLAESLGEQHSRTAQAQCQLAETLASDGQWDAGLVLLKHLHSRINPEDPSYRKAVRVFARKLVSDKDIDTALQLCEGSFPDTMWVHLATDNPHAAATILRERMNDEPEPLQRLHLLKRLIAMFLWEQKYPAIHQALADNSKLLQSHSLPGRQHYLELTEMRLAVASGDFAHARLKATEFLRKNVQPADDSKSLDSAKKYNIVDREWARGLLAVAQAELHATEQSEEAHDPLQIATESFEALHERMPQMPDYLRWTVPHAAQQVARICDLQSDSELAKQWRQKASEVRLASQALTLADDWFRTLIDPQPHPNQKIPY